MQALRRELRIYEGIGSGGVVAEDESSYSGRTKRV